MDRKCTVDGCERKHNARGFCNLHWARWDRGSTELDKIVLPGKHAPTLCIIEGCAKTSTSRKMCGAHYRVWRRDNNLDPKQSKDYIDSWGRSFSGRWSQLKRAARDKGLGFDISRNDYEKLLQDCCHYCNGPLNPTGHSLDRKDSSKGYLLDNVVTCCYDCNRIKSCILTYDEMVYMMKCLEKFRRKGGTCGS